MLLEELTQGMLAKAWKAWYDEGFPGDLHEYRLLAPTVDEVIRTLERGGVFASRLGIAGRGGLAESWSAGAV